MALNGVRRLAMQLGDQAQEERSRHVPPSTPLGDDEPLPLEENEDGSASVELGPEGKLGVEELEDGSALVDLVEDAPADPSVDFHENLAERLDESLLSRLSSELIDAIDRDKQARARRDEQYAEGIKRTGLGNEAPGGASFAGASVAVHPALVEGCIDFAARAMKELFPATGPVKTKLNGKQTRAKLQQAQRKATYMNWQATTQIKEYRRELEVLLTQLPLGGGQYLKVWYDKRWERIRTEFVAIDDLLLPFEATSLATAQRVTHVQRINRAQFDERVESGLYRDVNGVGDAVTAPEQTESAQAAAKAEGVEDIGYNEDGLRMVYETQLVLTLPKGADPLAKRSLMPYVLTVDEPSGKVLALRRNWDEKDNDKAEPLNWIVEFPFIPWRGAYPIGLAHIIGSLTGAATGSLRALLDSAHINNMPGGIKLKSARTAGQTINVEPTQLTEIDAGPGIDDIRKLAMPLPFNPPSAVLFQLLEWLTNQAKGVVGTAEEKIGDATNQMPVGTALALIEQGSITFSSIHSRLHAAQKEVLAIFHRLDARYLTDHEVVEELGELVVSRRDFQGPMDVEPVSDPNIFSDAQRYAQLQAAMQLATVAPQFYKQDELHKRALQLLKIPAPETLLNIPADPEERDALKENVAATDPLKALKAYEGQDHLTHLKLHLAFATSPLFGMNDLLSMPTLPALLQHCREHIVLMYDEETEAAEEARELVEKLRGKGAAGQETDAASIAEQQLAQQLGPLMPMLQQVQQKVQQLTSVQQPQDPRIAAAQMKQQTDQARLAQEAQLASQKQQLEAARLQFEQQAEAARQQLEAARLQGDKQLEQMSLMLQRQAQAQADALERWQTQVEMGTAQHNAHLAAMQADADRQLQLMLAQLKESSASDRQAFIDSAAQERQALTEQVRLVLGLAQQLQPPPAGEGQKQQAMPAQSELVSAMSSLLERVQQLLSKQGRKPSRFQLRYRSEDADPDIIPVYDDDETGEGS